jgi:hypothetical protein
LQNIEDKQVNTGKKVVYTGIPAEDYNPEVNGSRINFQSSPAPGGRWTGLAGGPTGLQLAALRELLAQRPAIHAE